MPTEFDKAKENAPVHVAIIMDGNGRWAKERGKPRIYGHNEGEIMDMGITKGTQVFVRKVAPLGDPVEVTVRGYELSLRKADAQMIEVE